jgi:WD repeat-containing protein 24
MKGPQDPVVASLANTSSNPYSGIAMSPNRQHAIVAGKDTLQLVEVSPRGLKQVRSMRINQHFQTAVTQDMAKIYEQDKQRGSFVRDTFGLASKEAPAPHQNMVSNVNVVITDVAWSKPQQCSSRYNQRDSGIANDIVGEDSHHLESSSTSTSQHRKRKKEDNMDSIIAAAGSNGVVVVWSARSAFLLESDGSTSSSMVNHQQPEAILSQHSRAVNRLAWHPRRPGLLLTASQVCKPWNRKRLRCQGMGRTNYSLIV